LQSIITLQLLKLTLILLFTISSALAFEPLNTDDAGTVEAGKNQIEQYFFSINRHGSSSASPTDIVTPGEEYSGQSNAKAFPFTYTRGISETLEASVATTYYNQPSGAFTRFSNSLIGFKWRFLQDEENRYAMAVKPTLVFPASKQQQVIGLGSAAFNYGVNLIASRYWDNIEIHFNLSYMHSPYNTNYEVGQSADPNRTNIFFVSAAPVWTLIPGIKIAFDIGATTNPPIPEQYTSTYGLVALILSPTENVDIGISAMRSANNYQTVISANGPNATRTEIGVTWRF
jgi:hypothetical protein